MRFSFENGGRTECRTAEALADYMEEFVTCTPKLPMSLQPGRVEIFDSGDMRVNFSVYFNSEGEIFREAKHLRVQIIKAISIDGDERQELRKLAFSYWAEAEALYLSRTVEPNDEVRVAMVGGSAPRVAGRKELERDMRNLMPFVKDPKYSSVADNLKNWEIYVYDEAKKERGPLVLTSAEVQKLIWSYCQRTPTQRAALVSEILVSEILARAEAALIAPPNTAKGKTGQRL